jgi:fructose-bisphosphate aldolase class II
VAGGVVITPTGEIVAAARAGSRGVGAFNVIQIEHAEAIVAGAEKAGTPVILQISENAVRYHGALEPLAQATLAVARLSSAPVAVHLDHATDAELVHQAVALGFGSVMYDASAMSYSDNVSNTAAVVRDCHNHGVYVEAELGEVGGKDGVHAPGVRTDPTEAAEYVAATGVDALAVAVGTSHAMLTRDATVDLELIERIAKTVPVPLVLHGSSGVPDDDLRRAVAAGMTKVNIATQLNKTFTAAIRAFLEMNPTAVDPRKYVGAGREAVTEEAARLLAILAA